jgi:hypothetical protein
MPVYTPADLQGNVSVPVTGGPPTEPSSYEYSEEEYPAYNPTPASGNDTNSSLPIYGGPPTEEESDSDASLMMNINTDANIAEQIPEVAKDPMEGFDPATRFEKTATHKFLNTVVAGIDDVNQVDLENSDGIDYLDRPEHRIYIPEISFIEVEELDAHHDHNHIHFKSNTQ